METRAVDIISIYAHHFFNGNQKQALDELIERYNLNFLEEEFLEQDINNDDDIIIKNTQQTNYSPLNVISNCSELVELTPELSSKSELSSKENKTVKRSALAFPSKQDSEKDTKIKNILSKLEHYKLSDPVDLYLKSRGIGLLGHLFYRVVGWLISLLLIYLYNHRIYSFFWIVCFLRW